MPKRKRQLFSTTSTRFVAATILLVAASSSTPQTHAFSIDRIKRESVITTSTFHTCGANSKGRRNNILNEDVLFSQTALNMSKNGGDGNSSRRGRNSRSNSDGANGKNSNKERASNRNSRRRPEGFAKTRHVAESQEDEDEERLRRDEELLDRITQLEALAASQTVEIRKLKEECSKLKEASEAFAEVVQLLRQAGLEAKPSVIDGEPNTKPVAEEISKISSDTKKEVKTYEAFDDSEIFGTAPSSVTDAADAAGTSILAALLGGKQRMLVDVRDAELSRDLDVLVQFIELSILPVAAGLEGLKTQKNRVKIVFPTVSLLSQYRRCMTLAAPEVISLSTLGFDPVEERDNLVVVVAPAPDDLEGLAQMNELLASSSLRQPVVVLNHHMVPLLGPGGDFEPVYHLRLLSVQYMTGESPPLEWEKRANEKTKRSDSETEDISPSDKSIDASAEAAVADEETTEVGKEDLKQDAELEAAMEHAHELGVHQGVTRAMVIRAYPRPWHIFVDTSPDSDADFEVAATFDDCPTPDDVNYAIVECLEGSEREDELVAQQMQEALEAGQLNTVSDMLGLPHIETELDVRLTDDDEDDEDDDDDDDWHTWGTDTV